MLELNDEIAALRSFGECCTGHDHVCTLPCSDGRGRRSVSGRADDYAGHISHLALSSISSSLGYLSSPVAHLAVHCAAQTIACRE